MSEQQFDNETDYQSYLEKHWIDDVRTLLSEHGQEYFDQLAQGLGMLFEADRVYIASYDLELTCGTTIVEYYAGQLSDTYKFHVPGSVHEELSAGQPVLLDGDLTEHYPGDDSLVGCRGIIGRPVFDEGGSIIGVIVILFKQGIRFMQASNSILDLCLGRVSTEMMGFYKNRQLNEMNLQLLRELAISNQLKEELSRLAYMDRVTGLPNREQFMVDIKMFRDLSNYWMAQVGIDCFKPVNESLGLESGDQLLREIGQGIANLNIPGTRVYRWTGDEFMMLGSGTNESEIEDKIQLCDVIFQQPIEVNQSQVRVTRSTGVTHLSDHETIDNAVKSVCVAMRKAKMRGGNRVVFYERSMDADQTQFFKVHSMMQESIARHQFVPHYQPIYDPKCEAYVGYEALMRWMDDGGNVIYSPSQFIPVAERSGLIIELGKQMIATAIGDIAEWNATFKVERDIAINLSPLQFHDDDLIRDIDQVMQRWDVDPSIIKFEITESLFVQEGEFVLKKLRDLKAMGFRLSLDDFGTGYSSLSYLQKYPFDLIKVDKCFVDEIVQCNKSKALIRAVKSLAGDLGMKVVAEGVETEEQAHCLEMMGVDYLQGYYFSKPIPALDIADLYTGTPGVDSLQSSKDKPINLH